MLSASVLGVIINTMSLLNDLPSYVYCPDCSNKHFLTLNRDIQGKWTIGYVEFEEGQAISGLALNGSDSVSEACARMGHALERYNRRDGDVSLGAQS